MAKLQKEIFEAFVSRLEKAKDVSPEMVDGLKEFFGGDGKKKPAERNLVPRLSRSRSLDHEPARHGDARSRADLTPPYRYVSIR